MVKHAKNQLKEGMVVLAEMLSQADKLEIDLQLVLFSKKFTSRSAVVELQKLRVFRTKNAGDQSGLLLPPAGLVCESKAV